MVAVVFSSGFEDVNEHGSFSIGIRLSGSRVESFMVGIYLLTPLQNLLPWYLGPPKNPAST
jgi:hypothetical protein